MGRDNSRAVFGTYHEAKERPEAHRGRGTDKVKSRYRRFEAGVQFWRPPETLDRTPQMLRDVRQTSNINIVTATGDDMVNHQPTFTCITCKAQRHTPGHFARIGDSYSEMDRQPTFNSGAEPPCPLCWQVAFNELSSPSGGHSMHRARKLGKRLGF
jgi:hypothetical protein